MFNEKKLFFIKMNALALKIGNSFYLKQQVY